MSDLNVSAAASTMPSFSVRPSTSDDSSLTQSQSMTGSNLPPTQQSQEYGDDRRASFKLGDSSDSDFDDFFPSLNRNAPDGEQSQPQPARQNDAADDDDDENLDEFFSNLS